MIFYYDNIDNIDNNWQLIILIILIYIYIYIYIIYIYIYIIIYIFLTAGLRAAWATPN